MTKIKLDAEEVSITRNLGNSGDGKITVNREGGGAIEINLGIASFGLTTDYGGAISLGIAGQEVTLGREGGTIHIGIGGFEVDVEARDCIVTEIKSIAGIIVAQRSYPDPGCELPDPLAPTPLSPPPPGSKGINIPQTEQLMWVPCVVRRDYEGGWSEVRPKISNVDREEEVDSTYLPFDMETSDWDSVRGEDIYSRFSVKKGLYVYKYTLTTDPIDPRAGYFVTEIRSVLAYKNWLYGVMVGFFGSGVSINAFINAVDKHNEAYMNNPSRNMGWYTYSYEPIDYFPVGKQPARPNNIPTGNKPPMRDCCEEILDELADIKEAFDIDRMLKDKFPVSNAFMAPGCDAASVTTAKTYYEAMQCLFRTLAHGLIFEPKVLIKDADAAKAGDQEFKARYLNATGWASAMAEALLEVKDDGNVSTNMDIRSGFAATQTMVGVADAIYRINAIIDSLGIEVIPKVEIIETPFNVQIQIGKGFGEKNERQIDLNTDEATEKMLPTFLQTKKNKIKTLDVHPRERSLKDILENIEANLLGGN